MKLFIHIIILIALITGTSFGDDESWKIFDDTSVGEVQILIDPIYLQYLLDPANSESDSLFTATLIYKNALIASDTVKNIGLRIRGNTSRTAAKQSFRVDINHFVPGRQFYRLEKMNFNGEHNDPSIIRSKLCWDLFNAIGVPATRANHIKLYINNEYRGLYMNIEQVDDEFVQKRFGNQDGNLYKCLHPADLSYLGSAQESYKQFQNERRTYDLNTNKEMDDYSDLVNLIDILNNTPVAFFKQEFEKVFNVDNFLKSLAVDVLVGSWDDYWFLKNNYYLYHNTATDKFEFIPYDYDNTYGIDWVGQDWGKRDIYNWGSPNESRPLVTRILNVPEYRNTYSRNLLNLMNNQFALEKQQPRIDQIKAMITQAAEADVYRTLDWDFSIGDFHSSYTNPVPTSGNHVPYGIKQYIQTRISSAMTQLNFTNVPPRITNVLQIPDWPEPSQIVTISADIHDDNLIQQVRLIYKTATSNYQSVNMYDDGNHQDGNANDGRFATQIPPQTDGTIIYYYVAARDIQNATALNPAVAPETAFYFSSRSSSLSDILVSLHFKKVLKPPDVGIGLLGSFNNWANIYPLQNLEGDTWKISLHFPPGNYIYKFVTYKNLNGTSGVGEWFADPENPESDGAPYYNSVLNVTNPMIYYLKPFEQDTILNNRLNFNAAFASSKSTTIDAQSLVVKIDHIPINNASLYFNSTAKFFSYRLAEPLLPGKHTFLISVKNSQGAYAEKSSTFFVTTPLLFINEFMASNVATQKDEFGEYDDWIEIYNGDTKAINMGGFFLTDDFARPKRWIFPDITLQPGQFLIVWIDDDKAQGPLHTSFKLAAGGEKIGIFASEEMGNFPVDTLSFGTQTGDKSYGRFPDGKNSWVFMQPTPGKPNNNSTSIETNENPVTKELKLWQNFPNPFNPTTNIRYQMNRPGMVSLKIFNLNGQEIKTLIEANQLPGEKSITWDGRNQNGELVGSGLYLYQLRMGNEIQSKKLLLLK